MRLITIRAPQGLGQQVAQLAFNSNIAQVNLSSAEAVTSSGTSSKKDVIDIETATPKAKEFIEVLMIADFYDPQTFSIAIRHPESVFASESPEEETQPIIRPTTDVYMEFWQFSKVTVSMVGRVFLSSILLSYGMLEDSMPLIIAGLLFLPYHHFMLCTALGGCLKEWRYLNQGLLALLVSTLCIVAGGFCVGLFGEHIKYDAFNAPVITSFLIALVVGIAAGLAAIDDAGRRELIGLAATAHISIYPAWFGLKLAIGFNAADKPAEHLLVFLMNVTTLILAAAITFYFMKMNGKGIRRIAEHKRAKV